ncbi:MAG TPA: RecQ family zinc-binding domain-containing protein, partial [Chryseosolibacter sp.]|nr:RecQ family zinc-binding domain-containing protein [Chryseosolibacter sp.]
YGFDIHKFCDRFSLNPIEVYNALKKLEEEGIVQFNESFYSPSLLHFEVDHGALYQFQVANAKFDEPLKMLLRLYGGELFSGFVKINEPNIARALQTTPAETVAMLKHLADLGIVSYMPVKDEPQVTFVMPRQDADKLPVDRGRLEQRRLLILGKLKAMIGYTVSTHQCRMQMIQDYFNEVSTHPCNICDVCIGKRKKDNLTAFKKIKTEVLNVLLNESMHIEKLEERLAPRDTELFIDAVREMVDEGTIEYDQAWRLKASGAGRKL